MGTVSALCHEAPVALAVLTATLKPYQASGKLIVLLNHLPKSVTLNGTGDQIVAVTFTDRGAGNIDRTVQAAHVLDATELGDLLPLANVDFLTGAESRNDQPSDSQELHALAGNAQPLSQQSVSWCFPLEYIPGEDFTIARPASYAQWESSTALFAPFKRLRWVDIETTPGVTRPRYLFGGPTSQDFNHDMWHYRRIFWRDQCLSGVYPSDITLVNWPQNDYWDKPLVGPGVTDADRQQRLAEAKELSRSFLYWMQTAAPHPDGSTVGYPGLRLRPDLVGTADGFAKSVYVRESRRIKAAFTIYEKYVGADERRQRGLPPSAEPFPDSIGIGYYRLDLHPSTGGTGYIDLDNYRFQIPLGAFIQQSDKIKNFLPAAKNIGTIHITNGCYRLHPVEWNIGEAAGALAAFCLARNTRPATVRATLGLLGEFQGLISKSPGAGGLGFVLAWPQVNEQEAPDGRRYGGGG
jgi:hypothetical protein